jgi:ABC-type glycerol-3-phosphate transport system substrate-binding protein
MVDLFGKYRAGVSPGVPSTMAAANGTADFANGNVAMAVFGLWSVPDWRAKLSDDWDAAPLPYFQGKPRAGLAWGSGNAMAKGARNPDGAWHLAKYLAGPEAQAAFMRGGYVQPMLTAQASHPSYREGTPPHSKDVPLKEAELATAPAFYPHSLELDGMIQPGLDSVTRGAESLDVMLARVVPLMNQKIREYKARFSY